ncbi:MAG TPA: hypothetical protein VKB57_23315 [Acidimicrobiales bacterium]|nr:hypothetical protein [Acidimicrobiales bacterium]
MRMRLVPEDDYMHPREEASNFNESAYYNFYDGGCGLGGWVRLGNRPNEGYAEMTTCLYLPDGRVAFWFGRPRIEDNDRHAAGGLSFEVVRPFEEHRLAYEGPAVVLEDPSDMEDPRQAFSENPRVDCRIEQVHRGIARAWGGEPEAEEGETLREVDPERSFARGHFEQHMAVTGTVSVGDESFELTDGLGLRDHSWGPRYWQNIWWYRWLTVNLGPDLGFATTIAGDEADRRHVGGFLYDRARHGEEWVPIRDVELSTDFDDRWYHTAVHAVVHTDDHRYDVDGEVWSSIPLRNRRNGLMTRITEGMTRWRCGDLEGAGLSEYLDQIVDGRPVGAA